jgi:hypothetical protein
MKLGRGLESKLPETKGGMKTEKSSQTIPNSFPSHFSFKISTQTEQRIFLACYILHSNSSVTFITYLSPDRYFWSVSQLLTPIMRNETVNTTRNDKIQ